MASEAAIQWTANHWREGWFEGIFLRDAFVFMPTGSYAPNGYGVHDMIGNVMEWCSDDWNAHAYLLMMNGIKPKSQTDEPEKVVRGGGVHHSLLMFGNNDKLHNATKQQKNLYLKHTIHIAERDRRYPSLFGLVGFRCVLDPQKWGTKSWNECR